MNINRCIYAITIPPANGLNNITIPSAAVWDENMKENCLFHLFSYQGNLGLGSSFCSQIRGNIHYAVEALTYMLGLSD